MTSSLFITESDIVTLVFIFTSAMNRSLLIRRLIGNLSVVAPAAVGSLLILARRESWLW